MLFRKRTVGWITAMLALIVLSLPTSADAGETDMAAGGTAEDSYVQAGTINTPVISSGETDSYAVEPTVDTPAQVTLAFVDGIGETDRYAGGLPEDSIIVFGQDFGSDPVTVNADHIFVQVKAGETDQMAGIQLVSVDACLTHDTDSTKSA